MKRVLMVLESEFPPDERVEKEIESLQRIGIKVSIAVYTFNRKCETEIYQGYTIYRNPISKFLYKSSAVILLIPLYFNFWRKFLESILSKEKFDIIHVHDLPLSGIGYRLARKYRMKLVCDQHEYYSNWIVRTRHYNTPIGKVIRLFSNWSRYERKYLQKADLVITVADSLKRIYIEKVHIPECKIVTLPNTPQGNIFQTANIDPDIVGRYKNYFVLFYAGSLDHLRGIDFVIECVAKLRSEIKEIKFLIAGKENRAFSLNRIISELQVENVVDYIGWVPLDKLPSYVAASKLCVFVPKADNLEINNTIATKIYQYAAMGKPVIVSEARMMKEFVESNNIGFSVKFGNIKDFCDVVKKIFRNPEISAAIKTRAVDIASRYTWENTSQEFTRIYEEITS